MLPNKYNGLSVLDYVVQTTNINLFFNLNLNLLSSDSSLFYLSKF